MATFGGRKGDARPPLFNCFRPQRELQLEPTGDTNFAHLIVITFFKRCGDPNLDEGIYPSIELV